MRWAVSIENGVLYVVATPIGNRGDITERAKEVLNAVSLIAAEDTRHSRPLLKSLGISTRLVAMHEHNEREMLEKLTRMLQQGDTLALISDAGTPLISDPGFPLVRTCHQLGIRVSPLPGPSAAIAALSAAGLPTDRFRFEGFSARTSSARKGVFETLKDEPLTLIFYESSHRIQASLADMAALFGEGRQCVLARELTKLHETIIQCTLGELCRLLENDPDQRKGEFVILIAGATQDDELLSPEALRILKLLVDELPVKKAAALTARITGEKKNRLYQQALILRGE
uniref:16S rRNA (cytidine(1402)-2'-O)-methyltransferase n=1 Tax=Candidatus Vondammii sp. HM_W22 TaxID=2687299 RepID=UPI001F13F4B7|nr:16S rRNA (cytidine(1402)-2'-O)-methyltransferase [Candidatus Vondammii sp. HM_W22]